jgi:PRC-barrel domain
MERRFERADEILGADVRSPEGSLLGQIDDLVIDRLTGQVRYVIIDFGHLLDQAPLDTHFPLPWPMLNYNAAGGYYTLSVSEAQLNNAPDFDDASLEDRNWERRIHAHYKVWPYWAY